MEEELKGANKAPRPRDKGDTLTPFVTMQHNRLVSVALVLKVGVEGYCVVSFTAPEHHTALILIQQPSSTTSSLLTKPNREQEEKASGKLQQTALTSNSKTTPKHNQKRQHQPWLASPA